MPLDARLFGEFSLHLDGHDGPAEVPSRMRLLLAYLWLQQGRRLDRTRIAFDLWPDSSHAQAHTNLRQLLRRLLQLLPTLRAHLDIGPTHLGWHGEAAAIDVAGFDQAVARADEALSRGDHTAALRAYLEAESRYRGDVLPDHDTLWLEEARDRYRQRFLHVIQRLVAVCEALGRREEAARHAEQLVHLDPLGEGGYRQLMRLYLTLRDRPKALHTYHRCARALEAEVGITPDAETEALYHQVAHGAIDGDHAAAPLVGRARELARLEAAWHEARRSGPRLLVLAGDAGVGTSRLVESFLAQHRALGATSHEARGLAAGGSQPFSALRACLTPDVVERARRRLAPVWFAELERLRPDPSVDGSGADPVALTEPWQRLRLFEALTRALLEPPPTVLVVDDAHWCDHETLEWLRYVLRADSSVRCLCLVVVRTGDLRDADALQRLQTEAARLGRLDAIELTPLDEAATRALAEQVLGRAVEPAAARRLFQHTEGYPLFIVEMLRAGTPDDATVRGPLPARIHAALQQRLAAVEDHVRPFLDLASVIGVGFTFDVLHAASGREEAEVTEAVDAMWRRGILRPAPGGRYAFSHALLQEVAYADLSPARRQGLHRRVAETLARLEGAPATATIAVHHERGGSTEAAIASLLAAARQAAGLYALADAHALAQRGLTLLGEHEADGALHPWWRQAHGEMHALVGDLAARREQRDEARRHYRLALERMPHDVAWRAEVRRKLSATLINDGRIGAALSELEAAAASLGDEEARSQRAWQVWLDVQAEITRALYFAGGDARAAAERTVSAMAPVVARSGTVQQRIAFAQSVLRVGLRRQRYAADAELLEHARSLLAAAHELEDVDAIADARFRLGFVQLFAGDLSAARTHLLGALEAARHSANALLTVRCLAYVGVTMRRQGDAAALARQIHPLRDAAEATQQRTYVHMHRAHLASLARHRGDWQAARSHAQAAIDGWQASEFPLLWLAVLPWLAASLHLPTDAAALRARLASLLADDQQRLPAALEACCQAVLEATHITPEAVAGIVATADAEGYA